MNNEPIQKNDSSIAAVTATISHLFGIAPPEIATAPAIDLVTSTAAQTLHGQPIDRCLIFAPDALGRHLLPTCEEEFAKVRHICPLEISTRSVMPSKTPVCFASMFTGAEPAVHGIRQYEKPVLRCDTLFDALIRAGRKPAIVAVKDSSVDLIFRDRDMTYFSEANDQDTTQRTLELLRRDVFDVIVCYQQEYDDMLHKTNPFSNEAIDAVSNHVRAFEQLAECAKEAWSHHNYALACIPDHGAHTDPIAGNGAHGEDIAEDMNLYHWYGIMAKKEPSANFILHDAVTNVEENFPFPELIECRYFKYYKDEYYDWRNEGLQLRVRNYLNLLRYLKEIHEYNEQHANGFKKRLNSGSKDWKNCEAIFSEIIVYRYYIRLVYERIIKSINQNTSECNLIIERLDGSLYYLEVLCIMPDFRKHQEQSQAWDIKSHTRTAHAAIRQKLLGKIERQKQFTEQRENFAVIEINDSKIARDFTILSSLSDGYKIHINEETLEYISEGYDWRKLVFHDESTKFLKGIIYFNLGDYESRKFICNPFYK
jgi:hypothetical protein